VVHSVIALFQVSALAAMVSILMSTRTRNANGESAGT
jgi:hypothetical protein